MMSSVYQNVDRPWSLANTMEEMICRHSYIPPKFLKNSIILPSHQLTSDSSSNEYMLYPTTMARQYCLHWPNITPASSLERREELIGILPLPPPHLLILFLQPVYDDVLFLRNHTVQTTSPWQQLQRITKTTSACANRGGEGDFWMWAEENHHTCTNLSLTQKHPCSHQYVQHQRHMFSHALTPLKTTPQRAERGQRIVGYGQHAA